MKKSYISIAKTQCVAVFLAKEFNKIAPLGSQKVFFLDVALAEHRDETGQTNFLNAEALLCDYKKRFTKWTNNAGKT